MALALVHVPGIADDALSPGLHWAGIREVRDALVTSYHRSWLFDGFIDACIELRRAGCSRVFLGGSFTTSKQYPGDYDACWDPAGVSAAGLDPLLYNPELKLEQKGRYRGEWFIGREGNTPESEMYRFISRDTETGSERGMIGIKLRIIELINR